MKKKIFAVSDIHGHCRQLKNALDEAGFSSENDTHLLLVCGDLFDRGNENRDVLNFLNSVQNKVLIRGNHEDILSRVLREKRLVKMDYYNGLDRTVFDFFGKDVLMKNGILNFEGKEAVLEELHTLLSGMYDYFETEHYIFTHGWLPVEWNDMGESILSEDFRHARPAKWERARFAEWYAMYRNGLTVPGKTVVCGHRASAFGYLFDQTRKENDSSVFLHPGIAAIDALTVQSGRVNVFVVEEDISFSTHEMMLKTEPFSQMKCGNKKAELRLFDDKRKKLRVGDEILFTHSENTSETISAKIIGLHYFYHFDAISWDFEKKDLGIPENAESISSYMKKFYSDDAVWEYGALVIRLQILNGIQ